MKLLILTAIVAAVAASPLVQQGQGWPWQVGKDYRYEVESYTWANFDNSQYNGNAFKGQFVVRVLAQGHLVAKLENSQYAQAKNVEGEGIPALEYKPVEGIDQPFEIFIEEGRVESLNVPASLSVTYENLLKGLVSSLQVDLSTPDSLYNYPYSYDKESFQGVFKRLESDVTGDCDTLYTVSPTSAGWRRELPLFTSEEDPIEVTKTKNYGSCRQRVGMNYGLPEGSIWNGIATHNEEKQFIKHTSETRFLVGKQGTIYKSETTSSVSVSPLLFGKQKSEVKTYIKFNLLSVAAQGAVEWKKTEESRQVTSLLFTLDEATFTSPSEKPVADAQKLLQDLTSLLQNPGSLPSNDFLSKFEVLSEIISYMTSKQLAELTSSIEVDKTSKNTENNNMWIIYRDAVAQAGTEEAFKEIKSWILTKKLQGADAGATLSALAAGFWVTTDIAPKFFEFAFETEIVENKILFSSALLAATRVIRNSDNQTFIISEVIPRLSKELKQAVEKGDSNNAQVFIRALGNLIKTEVLQVYAPYLEGTIPVSKYLRRQIVVSLKNLANAKDEYARAVLFSIVVNTAEPYEIRVAAALNIFMAFPTAEMFQKFAIMTQSDPSTQVRAVLSNTIAFAAKLKDPRFAELARNAKAVLDSVSKVKYGYRYSTNTLIDVYTDDEETAFLRELSFIGSEDNILPKYQRTALRSRSTAWTEESEGTISISNLQQLFEYIKGKLYSPTKCDADFKFSAKKIAELLNIKRNIRDPLEGELFMEILNQQKLITFDDADFKSFIDTIVSAEEKFSFTKLLNKREVVVVFPLATGMPFYFEYNEPLLLSIESKAELKLDTKSKASGTIEAEFEITYSRNLEGSAGFVDTLGDAQIASGVINEFQIYAPVKLEASALLTDYKLKINMLNPDQDANIVHFSVSPYTTIKNKNSLITVLEDPTTKLIKGPTKYANIDKYIGFETGMIYNSKGFSYSSDFLNVDYIFSGDVLADYGTLMFQKDVALTEYDYKYLGESKNKIVTLNFFYDTLYDQNDAGEWAPAAVIDNPTSDSTNLRVEIAERAARGMKSAEVRVFDFSAIFEGPKPYEWLFAGALAESHVDRKFQGAFFLQAKNQINMVFKVNKPEMYPLNFEEALNNEIEVTFEADFKFANTSNIYLKGYGERTAEYKEQLMKDPKAKSCLLESSQKNLYQMDCYKMIVKAHAPDKFKAEVSYEDESVFSYFNVNFYNLFKEWFSEDKEVYSLEQVTPKGKMHIEAQAYYYDQYVNYEFKTHHGSFLLRNVEGMKYYPYATALYGPLSGWERSRNWFTGYQNIPMCVVDDNKILTFSGRSYDYSLTSSWHVVMLDEANKGQWSDLVILARRPSENQEEVYISYKPGNGKYVEVEIKPSGVQVKSSASKTTEGALTLYWDEDAEAPLLEYYDLATGVKVFDIEDGGIRIIYDKQRLVVFTDGHRTYTRGICGQSSSQVEDDYLTPWGIVDAGDLYGASFSLEGDNSDAKTVELKKEAKQKAYQPVTKYTTFLRYDAGNQKS